MTKIEAWRAAKRESDALREFADSVNASGGYNGYDADKFGADVSFTRTWLGFYGNSSAPAWSDATQAWMKRAIDDKLRYLAEHAAILAEANTEKRRVEAQDEAQEVLQAVVKQ